MNAQECGWHREWKAFQQKRSWEEKSQQIIKQRLWLCDTGCPYDLVARGNIDPQFAETIKPANDPVTLDTANGSI